MALQTYTFGPCFRSKNILRAEVYSLFKVTHRKAGSKDCVFDAVGRAQDQQCQL